MGHAGKHDQRIVDGLAGGHLAQLGNKTHAAVDKTHHKALITLLH